MCNMAVRKVTKGTVAVPLGTRMYRVSCLKGDLFDENENPSESALVAEPVLQRPATVRGGPKCDVRVAAPRAPWLR